MFVEQRDLWLRLRKSLMALTFLMSFVIAAIWLFAPQIFTLAGEGFPDPTWPAHGDYATVAGTDIPSDPPLGRTTPAALQGSFQEREGRALLMAQQGQLHVEYYAHGLDRSTRLNSYSMVKSLVGAMILRGVASGKISSLDDPLSVYLDDPVPDVSIRDVLTMRSGLRLGEHPEKPMEDGSFSPFGGLARLHAYGLDAIMPGLHPNPDQKGTFGYASVNTALLGAVLEKAYDEPLPDILSREIWKPAGAQTAFWRNYPGGHGVTAYCCLYARPLDWLLVGQYIMDNKDQTFLPDDLWREFLMPNLTNTDRAKGVYGNHIRHDLLDRAGENIQGPFAYFFGHQGQIVYFLPDKGIVAVRFGAQPQLLHSTLYELFR